MFVDRNHNRNDRYSNHPIPDHSCIEMIHTFCTNNANIEESSHKTNITYGNK